MTYNIYVESHYINWDILHKADSIAQGLMEEVLPGVIAWHGLKLEDLPKAIDFIKSTWRGLVKEVEIMEEHFLSPSYCEEVFYKKVQI